MQRPTTKRTLATCSATHTLHDGLSDITYVLLPILAQAFNLSLAQVGLIRSAHRTAMAAFQIPAGLIAERFGERDLLALGTAGVKAPKVETAHEQDLNIQLGIASEDLVQRNS